MTDSDAHDRLATKHDRNEERRIERIKRWVEYIRENPPETWGPQQNAVVDGQLDAARAVQTTASHRRRVERLAEEIAAADETSGRGSE
jgi:cob(I)alamin adenosyltransferase